MKLTIDANLFVARFRRAELGHKDALAFFKNCDDLEAKLFAPVFVLGEVAGALARIRGEAQFGEVALTRILALRQLQLRQIDVAFAERAARIAIKHHLRGADAAYLTLAEETKSTLITNDGELLLAKSRVVVMTPEAWLAKYH